MNKSLVMLSAGGTGGHLFPAFALAEELGRRGLAVELMTDRRGDRYGTGFPARAIHAIPAATLTSRSPLAIANTAWTLARGLRQAFVLLGRRHPAVVVGFGGYPTFAPMLAARLRGIPTVLHEQNAVLGRANRWLAKRVDQIATSFAKVRLIDGALAGKTRFTGNPVRRLVLDCANRRYQPPTADGPVAVLVFGGSQGARFFADTVPPALAQLPTAIRARLSIVQQAREEDLERTRLAFGDAGITATVETFFADLPRRMADAHLIIGRAGASTVAELAVIGRPSILVPLPHALDNDQLRNAASVAESGGAWCIEQKDLDPGRLAVEIERLVGRPDRLEAAAAAVKAQGRPDAVERLADLVEELRAKA